MRFAASLLRLAAHALLPSPLLIFRVRTRRPVVAITFDDGPDESTPALLDALDRSDLRATFFVLGAQVMRHPDLVAAITRRGHEVASHGYSHREFSRLTPQELASELLRTSSLLPPPRGLRPLVRPPRGSLSPAALATTAALGYSVAHWSIDSLDHKLRDPAAIARHLGHAGVAPGDVILLHEGQPWTRDVLPSVRTLLDARRLEAVPLGEMLVGASPPP